MVREREERRGNNRQRRHSATHTATHTHTTQGSDTTHDTRQSYSASGQLDRLGLIAALPPPSQHTNSLSPPPRAMSSPPPPVSSFLSPSSLIVSPSSPLSGVSPPLSHRLSVSARAALIRLAAAAHEEDRETQADTHAAENKENKQTEQAGMQSAVDVHTHRVSVRDESKLLRHIRKLSQVKAALHSDTSVGKGEMIEYASQQANESPQRARAGGMDEQRQQKVRDTHSTSANETNTKPENHERNAKR